MTLLHYQDKIYVAGHRGLVGSAIWRALQREGFSKLIGRPSPDLDLRDLGAVQAFFEAERPDTVVLAAARVGGILANATSPADFYSDNIRIQVNVMDSALKYGARRLLFLGSSCIYPKFAPQPIQESALLTGPLEPTNDAYAIAKIAGVLQVQAIRRQHGLPYISAMPTNLYGPGDNFDLETSHVLPALIRKFHEAREADAAEVVVWGTGQARREFMHVDDMASACVQLLLRYDSPDPINVGTGEDLSIRDLVEIVAEIVGYRGTIRYDTSKPDGTPRKQLDVRRLRSLGVNPDISLRQGIASTYAWYSDYSHRASPDSPPEASFQHARHASTHGRDLTVGDYSVPESIAWASVVQYVQDQAVVVHQFDCGGGSAARAESSIGASLFGRIAFFDRSVTRQEALALLASGEATHWRGVPIDASLLDADPGIDQELYDQAESAYRQIMRAVPRLSSGTLSAIGHLLRPALIPLLDFRVRGIYARRASQAWAASQKSIRPRSQRSFWPAIRDDLRQYEELLGNWRARLEASDEVPMRRAATLTSLRLWDIVIRQVAVAHDIRREWSDNVPPPV